MTSRIALISAAVLFAGGACAQTIGTPVASDLNGDGAPERFTLIDSGKGTVDLQIENTSAGVIFAEDIAWLGGIGQQAELDLAPNGSVRLTSMNEAIGRNRWHLTLTIAFRQGRYMVAGYTYDWYDTLDLENSGTCDLNLLTGAGTLARGTATASPIQTTLKARPVTDWRDVIAPPPVCQAD